MFWSNKKNTRGRNSQADLRSPLALPLEPRMMFDGAVAATVADTAAQDASAAAAAVAASQQSDSAQADSHPATEATTPPAATSDQRQEVVFIDSRVPDYQQLVNGLKPGTEVVVLDGSRDGLQQMADYLEGRSDIDAIHVLSHGKQGSLELGSTKVNSSTLGSQSALLAEIGQSLGTDGDLLLYACQTGGGEIGERFITQLASLTQADVAASTDNTGHASLLADWNLESRVGDVESALPFTAAALDGYRETLATTLSAGDIAVIGFNSDQNTDLDSDGFQDARWAIVALTDIEAGTVIHFTDAGFTDTGNFLVSAGNEGHLTWTVTTNIAAGTVLVMDTVDGSNFADLNGATAGTGGLSDYGSVTGHLGGSATGASIPFATGGDQLIVYQGTAGSTAGATFIYALSSQQATVVPGAGAWQTSGGVTLQVQSYLPTGLVNGTSALALTNNVANASSGPGTVGTPNYGFDNMVYQGTLTGTKAQLLAAIGNASNWAGSDSTAFNLGVGAGSTFNTDFTVLNPPTLVSAGLADNAIRIGETTQVTFVFSTAVSGFTTTDLNVPNGTISGLATGDGGKTWTGTFTPFASVTDPTNVITVDLAGVTSVSGGLAGSGTAESSNYAVDTVAPGVTSVSSPNTNGQYVVGQQISITVNFNDMVLVTGTPQLVLETGSTDRVINYSGGTGSSTLTFTYTVQAGDTSADLDYLSTTALSLNGGSIRDLSGNDATLTLAAPGAAGSLGANKNIVVNSAPAMLGLNGDSVAWAGVGNTANLDSGGNAILFDTEFGALNGGNGNWSGATLTVQRPSTAISSDEFGFNTAGALFSVNGNQLQSGGVTFATFTSTGGVLTISFTSSGTAATTALVNDVAQRITYRSDTPAGDANLRFTLNDGASNTLAEVTVTSDTIYVTNTLDTSTTDLSNGVSFSEAVAIAAADATGSQTLILSSAFANQTVSLAGNLSINESLALNGDAAANLILNGSTITLGGGTTLGFTNASGNVTVNSTIAGTGALAKSGAGTLTLGSTSNNGGWSGAMSVTGGTLGADTGSRLSSGNLTLDGGALAMTVTGVPGTTTTVANGVTLGAGGGTISVGGGGGANIANFTGVMTGSGGLTKTANSILQLSGTNNYSGTTTVSAGTLSIASDANLGSGGVSLNGGTTLSVTGATTIDNAIALNGNATLSNSATTTLSGAISGGFDLTKSGAANLTLSGTNSFAGITVDAGTLSISSDANLGTGTVTLNGGTLAITGSTTIDNAIAVAAASTISSGANATLSGILSGTGTLTKSGASTLTLSGSNTHSGAVNLTAGGLTLSGGSALGNNSAVSLSGGTTLTLSTAETIGSLAGSGNVVLNAGLTTGADNTSTTYAGVISGTSGLTKVGSGTMTLTGNNIFSGPVTVSSGGLTLNRVGGALSDSASVTVASGATLTISATEVIDALFGAGTVALGAQTLAVGVNGASSTFSGAITGSGTLTLDGGGTLALSGTNSGQSWGMQVLSGGTVAIAGDANLGSGTVQLNDGTLSVTSAGTIDNAITLGASAGSISVGSGLALSLSGAIGGVGALTKTGSGTLTLSGSNNYAGTTTVSAGTLSVNGSTASATTVASGATLAGSGTLGGNVTVQNGGTLSPGNSAGTLTINGNLQMDAGSTLAVEINGTSAGTGYDQILVGGSVDVSGATLAVTHGYTPGQGDTYVIISNDFADTVTGTFSGLSNGSTVTAGGNGTVLTASYAGGDGNDFTLTAPINDAPVLGNLNGGGTHTEGGGATVIDADVTVSDTELDLLNSGNGNYNGASLVLVRNGGANAQDIFAFNDGNGITRSGSQLIKNGQVIASFNTGTAGQLTLTFSDAGGEIPTTADVNAVLRQITYATTSDAPPASVTLSWTFSDGAGGSTSSSAVLNLVGTNDAPILAPSSPILTGLTDTDVNNPGQTVASFAGAGITDLDSGAVEGIAITGLNAGNGTWQYSLDGGASWQNVGAVSGTSALLLRSTDRVRFVPDGVNGTSASLTYRAWDQTGSTAGGQGTKVDTSTNGGSAPFSSASDTASITVTAVDDAPILTSSGGQAAFVEGDNVASTPVAIDGGLTVSDPDSPLLSSATVSITVNFVGGQDVLAFTNDGATMGDISASYNSATGVLTLTSASGATAAQWQAALRSVTYSNTSDTPNTASRTVSFSLSDGNSSSLAATRGVTVAATNDAPVVTVPPTINLPEDVTGALTGISFSDADAGPGSVSVIISVPTGSLSATSGGGVAVSGTSTALVLSGSIADINTFIAGSNLTYTPAANATGSVIVSVNISDNGLSGGGVKTDTDAFTLNVTPVNDAPNISAPGSISVNEDVAQSLTGISFSDIDVGSGVVSVTFSVASGTLSAISGSGVIVGGTASALTLTGTLANINAFVASGAVSFLTASNASSNVVLSLTIDDGGNTGSGGNLTASTTVTLAVSAVNDAPVNAVPAAQNMLQDGALVFSAGNGNAISISDLDAGGGTVRVTLTATNGLITLGSISGLVFSVGSGAGDATMTFDGSIVDINNALAGLTFAPTSGYFGPATLQVTTDDLGLSGGGGNQTDTDTISIEVIQPNPVITGVTSGSADGSYKVGDTLTITVTFDHAVNVSGGVPSLLLETGLVDRSAVYVSGSGSTVLTFAYVVQAGDQSADLNYINTAALSLNGASITSVSLGAPAFITLPAIGGGDSLADSADLVIDGIVPTVTSVSVPSNGTYVAGQNLDFTVNLSEAVTVDTTGGTPRIAITLDGGGTVFADYLSGSGTTALVFRLTVSSGQFDSNGISVGGSIQTNGGTLRDGVGNDANLTLNSVGATNNVRVDAVVPTVGSVSVPVGVPYNAGDTLTFVVNASEAVIVNGTPRLALDIGGTTVFADYVAGSGTSTLVFQYTVRTGDNDANGIAVTGLAANGATLQDAAGNAMNLALNNIGGTSGVIVDTVAPSPSGIVAIDPSPTNAGSVRFTVTFSEGVSGVDLSDFSLAGTGTAVGSLASLVQIDARTYQVTVTGLNGTGTLGLNLSASGTGIVDQAGNAITGGLTGAVYSVDRDAPTVSSVSAPVGVAYNAGDSLTFVVNLSEVVQVNGSPRLAIDMGGTTVFADYVAGSGTTTLVFQYSVRPGDNDANGIAVTGLVANGASLRDATGNDLNLTLNGVGNTSGVIVDTTAPGASATVTPLPTPGSVQYTVTFDESVSGVDLADFSLVTTGNVTGTLQSLAQVDARTFVVTVSNVAGAGTLTLGLNNTGTLITDVAGNPQVSTLSAQTYSVPQSDGDPEFRAYPPIITPPEPTVPVDSVLPSPPPPPFTSPLIPPPLFEVPTLGSGIPTLGNIFINQGALAPSFIAQVFGSSDGFADGSGSGFLGFGGGDGGVFGSSSLSGFFDKDVPQDSGEMELFDGKQWRGGSGGSGQGIFGAPTLGQQLQDIKDNEQRQVRELATALGQIQADRPQA